MFPLSVAYSFDRNAETAEIEQLLSENLIAEQWCLTVRNVRIHYKFLQTQPTRHRRQGLHG